MTIAVKLDSCIFYVKIRIWPCLDRIIPSLFKMIRPRITNKLNGKFLSLILKPLEFFSCQQSSPTTLDESSGCSISYFIIASFFRLSFWSLLRIDCGLTLENYIAELYLQIPMPLILSYRLTLGQGFQTWLSAFLNAKTNRVGRQFKRENSSN